MAWRGCRPKRLGGPGCRDSAHPLRSTCGVMRGDVHLVADKACHRGPRRREPAQYHLAALIRPPGQQSRGGIQEHCGEGAITRWVTTSPLPRPLPHS